MDELARISEIISFLEKRLVEFEEEAKMIADRFGLKAATGYRECYNKLSNDLVALKELHKQLLH